MKRKREDDGESNNIGATQKTTLKMKKSVVYVFVFQDNFI